MDIKLLTYSKKKYNTIEPSIKDDQMYPRGPCTEQTGFVLIPLSNK